MYSPKIREDLIPYLYKLGRHLGIPMTRLVNQFIEQAISHFKETGIFSEIEVEEKAVAELANHFQNLINDRKKKAAEVIELLRKIA
jgi:predicted urease superfamily metal-dependent hydrolase